MGCADDVQSGACTCVLSISDIYMAAEVGPIDSTIVENVKTIAIVAIGCFVSGDLELGRSAAGFALAIIGILA